MLTDSHCHLDCLDLKNYSNDVQIAINAARVKDVKYILSPGVSLETLPDVLNIVRNNPNLFAAIGVHPTEEDARYPVLNELLSLGDDQKIVGIGETGLDFYHLNQADTCQHQADLFKLHIQVARELKKPLIIHARNADREIIDILRDENAGEIGGVLHCFTGSMAMAMAAIELGFYISFSGIITFKNAHNLREIAKVVPLDKILIETDAPYLAPEPVRGKSNEPAYLPYIAEYISELLQLGYERLSGITTENFLRLFRIA